MCVRPIGINKCVLMGLGRFSKWDGNGNVLMLHVFLLLVQVGGTQAEYRGHLPGPQVRGESSSTVSWTGVLG